jgi:O-antigen/teichoic acid export membrane protein
MKTLQAYALRLLVVAAVVWALALLDLNAWAAWAALVGAIVALALPRRMRWPWARRRIAPGRPTRRRRRARRTAD